MTIKSFILKDGLLYLKDFVFTHEPIEVFVQNLIDNYVNYYETYSCKTNLRQCEKRKHRSFGDLYCICKYYYPSLSPKQLKKILNNKVDKGLLCSLRCHNINKTTYFTADVQFRRNYGNWLTFRNEFGMLWNDFNFKRRITKLQIAIDKKQYL
jgi:hypothetical protein